MVYEDRQLSVSLKEIIYREYKHKTENKFVYMVSIMADCKNILHYYTNLKRFDWFGGYGVSIW